MNQRKLISAVPSGVGWGMKVTCIAGAMLVLIGIMIGAPIAERVIAAGRDGYSACEGFVPPEGAVVDEVWEHQTRARVTAIPPELGCTYLSSSGTHITVVHDLGRLGAVMTVLLFGVGVTLIVLFLRARV